MTEIRTARLLLRPAMVSDLAPMHAVMSNASAMAYWSTLPHASLDETRAWLSDMMAIPPDEGEDFIVTLAGRTIGKAGLFRFPEIGFIFAPDMWGQGLAREALEAVVDRAFSVHGLDAVVADVDPRNMASLTLLARLGFEEMRRATRTVRVGDRWCDSVYLRLGRPEARVPAA